MKEGKRTKPDNKLGIRTWSNIFLFFSLVFVCLIIYMLTHQEQLKIGDPFASRRVMLEVAVFFVLLLFGIIFKIVAKIKRKA